MQETLSTWYHINKNYLTKIHYNEKCFRSCPHYSAGIWEWKFHSENESKVFRPHYAGGIEKHHNNRSVLELSLRKTRTGKSHGYGDAILFEKPAFSFLRFRVEGRPNRRNTCNAVFSNCHGWGGVWRDLKDPLKFFRSLPHNYFLVFHYHIHKTLNRYTYWI